MQTLSNSRNITGTSSARTYVEQLPQPYRFGKPGKSVSGEIDYAMAWFRAGSADDEAPCAT